MEIEAFGSEDLHYVVANLEQYWGSSTDAQRMARIRAIHHPMFVHQFGDTAFSIKERGLVIAYLLAFFSQRDEQEAYIHLVGVHADFRRHRLASRLYQNFFQTCAVSGKTRVLALTSPSNDKSIAFHRSLGMEPSLVENYRGDGEPVCLLRKEVFSGNSL